MRDPDFEEVERDRDDRLAEEAGEALGGGEDEPDVAARDASARLQALQRGSHPPDLDD